MTASKFTVSDGGLPPLVEYAHRHGERIVKHAHLLEHIIEEASLPLDFDLDEVDFVVLGLFSCENAPSSNSLLISWIW